MALDAIHRLVERIARVPPLRAALKRRYERLFPTYPHAFHGVFASFEEAAAAVPPGVPGSYDNDASARQYVGWHDPTDHDYPALHWMQERLRKAPCDFIADLGGSTGIKFHAFAPLLDLAAGVRWLVVDVPKVVALGRRLAEEAGIEAQVQFTDSVEAASGCDLMLASGSIQYLPCSLAELVEGMSVQPDRIIVNLAPIHPEQSFFTLNSIGSAVCPYRVTARGEFISAMCAVGYELRDSWRNRGKTMPLPFSPELSLQSYSGFCFDRVDATSQP